MKRIRHVHKNESKPKDKTWLTKLLFSIIFTLVSLIYMKVSTDNKQNYEKTILNNNINFSTFRNFYDKHLSNHFKKKDESKELLTMNDQLSFTNKEKYNNSTKLTVGENYIVEALKPGIIVYIGEKDDLGNTIIIQGNDGIDVWYSNIIKGDYSLYDYISKGDIIGTSESDYIYLTIDKNGTFLTYEEYIK